MVVSSAPFRALMHTLAKGVTFTEGMLQDALIYTLNSRYIRTCPSCGKHAAVACACPLLLVRKRHPGDVDTDIFNLMSYMGSFGGECYQAFYEGGVNVSSWISSMGTTSNFSCHAGGIENLESWAMWDTLHRRENPSRLIMPDADIDVSAIEYVDEGDRELGDSVDPISQRSNILARGSFSGGGGIAVPSDAEFGQFMSESNARGLAEEFPP